MAGRGVRAGAVVMHGAVSVRLLMAGVARGSVTAAPLQAQHLTRGRAAWEVLNAPTWPNEHADFT